jgi:all-trans-8'-apo-beta-carotenal 15,15'-oxygenase
VREAVLLERVLAGMLVDIDECPQGEELGCVRGSVPFNLSGHLIRCGPGTYRLGDVRYPYPGDGYGLLSQLVFDGAEPVVFRSRYIRSEAYTQEHKTLEERFRSLSTLSKEIGEDIGPLDFKNTANGSVIFHGGMLLATWELGLPHAIDPSTLETLGVYDFDLVLQNTVSRLDRQLSPHLPFHHRTRLDPIDGSLHGFGVMQSVGTRLMRYQVDSGGEMAKPAWLELKRYPIVRDFALTPRWEIYPLSPTRVDISNVLSGQVAPLDGLRQKGERPLEWLFIDREDSARYITINLEPRNVSRIINAWQEDYDTVVIDALTMSRYPDGVFWRAIMRGEQPSFWPRPVLTRFRINTSTQEASWRFLSSAGFHGPTFPAALHGRKHPNVWMAATSPKVTVPYPSAIARWDNFNEALSLQDYYPNLPGEPVFVLDPSGESPGWLIVPLFLIDSGRTELLILDAYSFEELAAINLPENLPPFGGQCWVPLVEE